MVDTTPVSRLAERDAQSPPRGRSRRRPAPAPATAPPPAADDLVPEPRPGRIDVIA
jgi:hypothetical protein